VAVNIFKHVELARRTRNEAERTHLARIIATLDDLFLIPQELDRTEAAERCRCSLEVYLKTVRRIRILFMAYNKLNAADEKVRLGCSPDHNWVRRFYLPEQVTWNDLVPSTVDELAEQVRRLKEEITEKDRTIERLRARITRLHHDLDKLRANRLPSDEHAADALDDAIPIKSSEGSNPWASARKLPLRGMCDGVQGPQWIDIYYHVDFRAKFDLLDVQEQEQCRVKLNALSKGYQYIRREVRRISKGDKQRLMYFSQRHACSFRTQGTEYREVLNITER